MSWIDLGHPIPWDTPIPYSPPAWPAGLPRSLSETPEIAGSFEDVIRNRHSRRIFGRTTIEQLSALLSLTCRVRANLSQGLGFPQTSRPPPSAGAIHPIHVVLHGPDDAGWSRYDPFTHELIELPSKVSSFAVRAALQEVLPSGEATIVLFAAEPALTSAKYQHATSLVWRDAGVLQGYWALAAEVLGLNCCLLGVTGEPWVSQLVDQRLLVGVGAAYVGSAA